MIDIEFMKMLNADERAEYVKQAYYERFGNLTLSDILDDIDSQVNNPNTVMLSHDEVFSRLKRELNEV